MNLPRCRLCLGTPPRPMETVLMGEPACFECARSTLNWEEETVEEGDDVVGRGPGFLMRRVAAELENAEGKAMTRRELEAVLLPQGFRSDNLLRSIRTLAAMRKVHFREGRFSDTSTVRLFEPVANPLSNERVAEILAEL